MNDIELRAYELFKSCATLENGYKTMSFQKIADCLENENLGKVNKSTVQRWSKNYKFEEKLKKEITQAIVLAQTGGVDIANIDEDIANKVVDITRNNELTASCYELLELYVDNAKENALKKGFIPDDTIKIIGNIASLTAGREDKLLDRLANSGDGKMNSDEMKKEYDAIEIEIED